MEAGCPWECPGEALWNRGACSGISLGWDCLSSVSLLNKEAKSHSWAALLLEKDRRQLYSLTVTARRHRRGEVCWRVSGRKESCVEEKLPTHHWKSNVVQRWKDWRNLKSAMATEDETVAGECPSKSLQQKDVWSQLEPPPIYRNAKPYFLASPSSHADMDTEISLDM